MLTDSYIVPECVIGPGSFGGLMALYESNFIKLDMLIGEFGHAGTPGDCLISAVSDDRNLYLALIDSTRYTRTFRLTYLFDELEFAAESGGDPIAPVADPDLTIRVYLDARMAEVAGWALHHRHAVLLDLAKQFHRELDRRWSNNMMLSKWLDFLLDAQHSFASTSSVVELPDAINIDAAKVSFETA